MEHVLSTWENLRALIARCVYLSISIDVDVCVKGSTTTLYNFYMSNLHARAHNALIQ